MAKGQVEDRAIFLLSALLSAALPMARYVQRHGNGEDREKLRRLTGSREYEELSSVLMQLRK